MRWTCNRVSASQVLVSVDIHCFVILFGPWNGFASCTKVFITIELKYFVYTYVI